MWTPFTSRNASFGSALKLTSTSSVTSSSFQTIDQVDPMAARHQLQEQLVQLAGRLNVLRVLGRPIDRRLKEVVSLLGMPEMATAPAIGADEVLGGIVEHRQIGRVHLLGARLANETDGIEVVLGQVVCAGGGENKRRSTSIFRLQRLPSPQEELYDSPVTA